MPSITWTNIRAAFARRTGFFESFTTTTLLAANDQLISTDLVNLGYNQNSQLLGKWAFIKGVATANVQLSRLVSAHTGSTGALTLRTTNLAVETGQVGAELMNYRAARMLTLINQARFDAFSALALPKKLITPTLRGNLRTFALPSSFFAEPPSEVRLRAVSLANSISRNLLKSDDADFADVANAWATANMTTAKTMTPVDAGDQLVPLVTGSTVGFFLTIGNSNAATVLNTLGTAFQIRGLELSFEVWVYCLTASRIKARIDEDATTSDSDFHTGTGWELLKVRRSITTEPTALKVGVVDTTNTAALRFYTARAFAAQGPAALAEESSFEVLSGWDYERPYGTTTTGAIRFHAPVTGDMALEIRGRGYLTSLSAEADTMEIDEHEQNVLLAYATRALCLEELAKPLESDNYVAAMERILKQANEDIDAWTRQMDNAGRWPKGVVVGLDRAY